MYLPHSFTIRQKVRKARGDKVIEPSGKASESTHSGVIYPVSSQRSFERTGVQRTQTYELITTVAAGELIDTRKEIRYDDRDFEVIVSPEIFKDIGAADHALISLSLKNDA